MILKAQTAETQRKIPSWAILAITMLVATGVRTVGISSTIVWYDETLTFMHISGVSVESALKELDCQNGPVNFKLLLDRFQYRECDFSDVRNSLSNDQPEHAPGFYEGLYLWKSAVGPNLTLLRLFPLLLGVLVLPAFYWLTYELFRSQAISTLATVMIALSPVQIAYSQELREYTLYCLVFSLSCAAFLRAWRTNTIRDWLLYAIISSAAFYSTFWMFLVTATQLVYSTAATACRKTLLKPVGRFNPHAARWLAHIVTLCLSLCAVSPVISTLILRLKRAYLMVKWLELPISRELLTSAWLHNRFFGWIYHPWYQFTMARPDTAQVNETAFLIILAIELSALVFMAKTKKQWPQLAFILLIVLSYALVLDLPDALLGGRRSNIARYFLPVTMLAFLPVCYMVCQLWQSQTILRRVSAIVISVFLIACQLFSFNSMIGLREHGSCRYPIGPIARILNRDRDVLVVADRKAMVFPNLLAIGRLLDNPRRSLAWFPPNNEFPDWFKKIDRFFFIVAQPGDEARFQKLGYKSKPQVRGMTLFESVQETRSLH